MKKRFWIIALVIAVGIVAFATLKLTEKTSKTDEKIIILNDVMQLQQAQINSFDSLDA